MVTAGAQHALTCAFAGCFKPGSRIAVDYLTYPGIKALASMMYIRLVPIKMDEDGMVPESLEIACRSNPIDGIYLMPACHNPTGILMGTDRREEIVTLIDKYQLLLIEDDAYYFTANEQKAALSSFLPSNSIFIAGFPKILFAGLRSAFVVASPKIRKKLTRAVLNTIWMAPTFNTAILCDAILDGTVDTVISRKLEEARIRNKIVSSLLPLQSQVNPVNGFFQWYKLPEPWTGLSFAEYANQKGVNVFCAEKFLVGSDYTGQYIRIAVSSPDTRQDFNVGLAILGEILQSGRLSLRAIN